MQTNVYIDGFNLYYGAVKDTSYKWLDLARFCTRFLPAGTTLKRIKYFTAKVSGVVDPDKPTRQQIFLRAVRTIPRLQVIYGHFSAREVMMPLVKIPAKGSRFVRVIRTDEKGSDVNLASHLLTDSFRKDCSTALVISNDSDLKLPIQIARTQFGITVGVICPHKIPSNILKQEASFMRVVTEQDLADSQFPPVMTDAKGTFSKPSTW